MTGARTPYWNATTKSDGKTSYMELLDESLSEGNGVLSIDQAGNITAPSIKTSGVNAQNGGSNTSGSAPIIATPVAGSNGGAAVQLSDTTRDYMVYLQIGTAGTAMIVSMGATSAGTDVTLHASGTATTGDLYSFRLPAGWYFKWSATTATLAQSVAVGC